jgi:hypothetical protein
MSKKHNKQMVVRQLSDLPKVWGPPAGTPINPKDHPVNNLPNGQALMSHEDISKGGNTQDNSPSNFNFNK